MKAEQIYILQQIGLLTTSRHILLYFMPTIIW